MKPEEQLLAFWAVLAADTRLSPTHALLYMAFCCDWLKNNGQNPVCFYRAEAMQKAKIWGIATFHKCMKDLVRFGYIEYEPSFNSEVKSRVRVKTI